MSITTIDMSSMLATKVHAEHHSSEQVDYIIDSQIIMHEALACNRRNHGYKTI